MMLPAALLIAVLMLGGVWADTCENHSRRVPVLVTAAEPQVTVYAWPGEHVELRCRPSQTGGCRWVKGSTELGTDCRLRTTQRGTIKCLRGEEICGSVQLNNPGDQQVRTTSTTRRRDWRGIYRFEPVYWQYSGESYWSHKSSTYLCSTTGTIIRQDQLCDGTTNCDGREDEWNCRPPCGKPFVGPHRTLSGAARDSYPDGSKVTHVCHPGFSFGETLSGLNRTCQAGRWTAPPPVCRRNVALNQTVSVTGRPTGDCTAAVDGDPDSWCMLAPGAGTQALAVQLADNTTVTTVLVRSLTSKYQVVLRDAAGDELRCSCQEVNDPQRCPTISGVRVCSCPEQQAVGRRELRVRAETGPFRSLAVAEVVALALTDADDECTRLGRPAHGRFDPAGSGRVKLACDPGHSRSCPDAVQCSVVQSGDVRLSCTAVSFPQPPAIPNTKIVSTNGTSWRAVAEYGCAPGYVLCPANQNTTASCDSDGLWTVGHITCLAETDIRVVAMRLGEQHARSMASLRAELQLGQQQLLSELNSTQHSQQQLLVELNSTQHSQQQVLAELNSTQHRLAKLEREVGLLGLAEGSHLQPDGAAAAAVAEHLQETTAQPTTEDPVEGVDGGVLGLKTATE